MKDLEWNDEYLVGIPAVDFQHQRIFDCMLSILGGPADDDRLRAEAGILKLLGLLQEHFSLEESVMRTLNYPELERHIGEHKQFHADVHGLAERFLRNKGGVSGEAIEAAQRWLKGHIVTSDHHYADFFSSAAHKNACNNQGVK